MKTQIIYLEPHDDYNSVRDKLNWTQAPRVIIVWPGRGRVLSRHFDLVMLKRFALKSGTQIGLVTLDPDVVHHAEILHIPTFDSLENQPEKAWRVRGERKISKPISPKEFPSHPSIINRAATNQPQMPLASRIAIFSIGFLAILFLIIMLIPRAVITIQPETLDLVKTYSLNIELDQSEIITNTSRLPARQVQSVLESQLRLPTTGRTAQPDQSAQGEVTFTNQTGQSLTIPTGTSVRTDDPTAPYFLTQSPVTLDPQEGALATVEVVASVPGPVGNVSAEAIQSIDGPLGLSASVSNITRFTGGSLEFRSAVSSADLVRARQDLVNNLFDMAHQALLGLTQEGEDLIPGSILILKTVEERFSNEVGDPADSLELSMILEFEGLVYSPDQLHSAVEQILINDLSKDEYIQPDTLKILEISDIVGDYAGEDTSIEVTMSAQTYEGLNPSVIRKFVRGRNVAEALEDLNVVLPSAKILSVDASPVWLNRFPLLDLQIHVRYAWEIDS